LEYPPVRPCRPRRRARGPDPADPAFTVGKGAVVFTPRGRRENDMGKPGGLGLKNILANEKFRRSQLVLDFSYVGFAVGKVLTENIERPDLLADKPLH